MQFLKKIAFYPVSVALRWRIALTRGLLRGRYQWHAVEALGIPGHGVDLLRVDFPPAANPTPLRGHGRPLNSELEAIFAPCDEHEQRLRACLSTAPSCLVWPQHQDPANPTLPWRENPFLTVFDLVALYGMLRHIQPERYLEIGSGMSTRVAWQARREGAFPMEIISVDPEPRVAIAHLCDRVCRRRLEEMTDEFLKLVTSRTVVFFDGSHRAFPGSDVTVFFLNLLPKFPPGTVVHIHDIYLPGDYPPELLSRLWSEQYMLASYLLGGGKGLKIILPCAALCSTDSGRACLESSLGAAGLSGSSLWLQVIGSGGG